MLSATIAFLGLLATTTPVIDDNYRLLEIQHKIEIAALQNNVDPEKMKALATCESGLGKVKLKHSLNAWNKKDPGKYGSRGIFQYQSGTFYNTAKQYGLVNADIWNVDHQIKLTAYLLAQNKWRHWYNCSVKIGAITR